MSENPLPSESQNTPPTSRASASKPTVSKKSKVDKNAYVKTALHLKVDHEHALRIASVQLQRKGDPIHTQQQMMDEAMERYTLYLQSKKDINFLGIIPDKPSPTK